MYSISIKSVDFYCFPGLWAHWILRSSEKHFASTLWAGKTITTRVSLVHPATRTVMWIGGFVAHLQFFNWIEQAGSCYWLHMFHLPVCHPIDITFSCYVACVLVCVLTICTLLSLLFLLFLSTASGAMRSVCVLLRCHLFLFVYNTLSLF